MAAGWTEPGWTERTPGWIWMSCGAQHVGPHHGSHHSLTGAGVGAGQGHQHGPVTNQVLDGLGVTEQDMEHGNMVWRVELSPPANIPWQILWDMGTE